MQETMRFAGQSNINITCFKGGSKVSLKNSGKKKYCKRDNSFDARVVFLVLIFITFPTERIENLNIISYFMMKLVKKKANISNQYNQVPHLTRDTVWESRNTRGNIKREPRGQPFPSSRWSTDNKNGKHNDKKGSTKNASEWSVKMRWR